MSTRYVYVDESKRSGYVMAAVVLGDPEAARKAVRRLVLPGQRRLHMVRERPARKRQIIDMLVAAKVTATIYDAGHHHPSELAARAACIRALVADLRGGDTQLVIERDEGLVRYDNQWMIEATRATGQRATLRFGHSHAGIEPLLALPDAVAWCWTQGRRLEAADRPAHPRRQDPLTPDSAKPGTTNRPEGCRARFPLLNASGTTRVAGRGPGRAPGRGSGGAPVANDEVPAATLVMPRSCRRTDFVGHRFGAGV